MMKKFCSLAIATCYFFPLFSDLSIEKIGLACEVIETFAALSTNELIERKEDLLPKISQLLQESPFDLMKTILSDDMMKNHLIEGLKNPQKAAIFFHGFGFSMSKEMSKSGFDQDLQNFCCDFSLREDLMRTFSKDQAWDRFVLYSFKAKSPKND